MSIIQGSAMQGASRGFYPFEITNSLRFNDDDSAFLSRTPSSVGNRKTFTFSCWLKKGVGGFETVFRANLTSNNFDAIQFTSDNQIRLFGHPDNTNINCTTDAVLRDPSAWYNVIFAVDTTQSTESNRVKIYVNGTLQSLSTATYPSHNTELNINNTTVHHLSGEGSFDGYMADVNFIDGTALDKDSFGETKENIWIPKDTSGLNFGNNGFRLEFKNSSVGSASSSTVGADTSGNNNHFSSTNIATTDNTTDSPTDNHATFNPEIIMMNNASSYRGIGSFSDGNLLLTTDADNESGTVPFGATSGKYYMELTSVTLGNRQQIMVFSRDDFRGDSGAVTTSSDGSGNATDRETWTSGDVIGIAVDLDNSKVFIAKNNNYFGTSNPATNTGGDSLSKFTGVGVRHDSGGTNTTTIRFNGGQLAFTHSPPSGFKSLSTANLNSPAIDPNEGDNATEYFNTVPYPGTSGDKTVTGVGFQPDWVWIKQRNSAADHQLYDSVRGVTELLESNRTEKEVPKSEGLKSFDSDGFTHGVESAGNDNSGTHVAWNWKAGGAPTADNSAGAGNTPTAGSVKIDGANLGSALAGTIPATRISANTEAGFSIVSYTGTGSNATVAHGLGAVPEWIIFRDRDNTNDWGMYHVGLGNTHFIKLNSNGPSIDLDTLFNDTTPTSSVFSLGTANIANNTAATIAYCFAPKEGYSKFGSYVEHYVSDYDVDSPYVHTGFRPAFLIIKGTSNGRDWVIYDSKRTPDDGVYLTANQNAAEQTDATNHDISFFSNGFKIRGGSGDINTTGESYIYMAFADQPFKFANGGTE